MKKKSQLAGSARIAGLVFLALALGLSGCATTSSHTLDAQTRPLDTESQPFTDVIAQWDSLTMEHLVRRAAQEIGATYARAGEVWPGTDFSDFQVLYFQDGSPEAWLVKPDGSAVAFPSSAIPKAIAKTPFFESALDRKINGHGTSVLRLEADYFQNPTNRGIEFSALPQNTVLFTIPIHEEFHMRQGPWNNIVYHQEALWRLPNEPQARVLRLHLIESLRQAVIQPANEEKHLSAAKFWLDRYEAEFPKEAGLVRPADVMEGSARYFHVAMMVRAAYGMDTPASRIADSYRAIMEMDYVPAKRYVGLPDADSYELGSAAGILLELKGVSGWQKRVEKGEPPANVLLEKVVATPQVEDPELVRIVNDWFAARK